ncbi:MAG: hypothetical protein ACWA47_12210 [Brevirhabdus sp.]
MWTDRIFVAGGLIFVFVLLRLLGAVFERRNLRPSAILLLISVAMLVYAIDQKPGGYRIEEIPSVVSRVLDGLI